MALWSCPGSGKLNPPVDPFDISTLGAKLSIDVSKIEKHYKTTAMARRGMKHIFFNNPKGIAADPRLIGDFLRLFPRLKILDFRDYKPTEQHLISILRFVPTMNYLTHLYLGTMPKYNALMQEVLKKCPNLRTLSMPNAGLRLSEYNALWNQWTNLTCLDLARCRVDDSIIHSIAMNLATLKELDISNPDMRLSNMGIGFLKNMRYLGKLVMLHFDFTNANDGFIAELSKDGDKDALIPLKNLDVAGRQMQGCEVCRRLGQSRFQLTDFKIRMGINRTALRYLLKNGKTGYINLHFTYPIRHSDIDDLWAGLIEVTQKCPGLQSVILTDCRDQKYREECIQYLQHAVQTGDHACPLPAPN